MNILYNTLKNQEVPKTILGWYHPLLIITLLFPRQLSCEGIYKM
jgi:hypothetical protein